MPVTARTLLLQRQIANDLRQITDAQTRALVSAWADAWDEVAPDLTAALLDMLVAGERVTTTQLLRSTRLRSALIVIAGHLEDLAAATGIVITGDLRRIIDQVGGAQASVIDSQLPPGTLSTLDLDAWARVDGRALEAIVARSTQRITASTKPLSTDAATALRRELIRGVAAGTSPRDTAARIVRRAQGRFNGGLNRALTIARTETLDAHRAAAHLARQQHADVLIGWRWSTVLDANTCPACVSMMGTILPLEEAGPLGHPNCRCTAVPVTKSWGQLGYPDVEEPPDLMPNPQTWFDQLPVDDQQRILGPTRLTAYREGRYPMTAWAQRRSSDGWRDSYVVSPAPSRGRSSRTAA